VIVGSAVAWKLPLPCAPRFPSNAAALAVTTMPKIPGVSSATSTRAPLGAGRGDAKTGANMGAGATAGVTPRGAARTRVALGLTMLALAFPSRAALANGSREVRELRGVSIEAVDDAMFESRASIAEALEFLERHHVNVVFPEVWYRGVTLHPSRVLQKTFGVPQDPRYVGRDPLAELIVEAHRRGIEVIPWFGYGFAASSAAHPTTLLQQKPEWAARDRDGKILEKHGFAWMNAFDPAVQEFVSGLMLEVARNYDVDGLHGDDRLPAMPSIGGYDKITAELWHSDKRFPPPTFTDSRWTAWRAGRLTDFLARLAKDVRGSGPGMMLSLGPSPYRLGLDENLQDAKAWTDRALVDLFHPQCYRRDLAGYQTLVDGQHELVARNSRVSFAPGILIQSGAWTIEPRELVRMVEYNRDRGYAGEVLSHYAGLRADDGALARALLAGPYGEPARVPYRSMHWRPKAREITPRPPSSAESWSRERGHLRAARAGPAEVVYALAAPATGWFRVFVEIPQVEDLPRSVECTFVGGDATARSLEVRPGLLEVGAVRLVDDGRLQDGRGRIELHIATAADESGRLAVGRALLMIDRKRSADAVWRED